MATYPIKRLRRLRYNPLVRDLVRETKLSKDDLIYPLFIIYGENIKNEVPSMPGVFQLSIENAVEECKELVRLGIKAVILFGIPEHKDEVGSEAYSDTGIIQRAIRAIKSEVKDLVIIKLNVLNHVNSPIRAKIQAFEFGKKAPFGIYYTNKLTGKALLILDKTKDYIIDIEAKGMKKLRQKVSFLGIKEQELHKTLRLKPAQQ